MRNLCASLALLLFCLLLGMRQATAQPAPQPGELDVRGNTDGEYDATNEVVTFTNGVTVTYTDASGITVLTAKKASVDQINGDVYAEGSVRIQKDKATWISDKVHYNFKTEAMDGDSFRMGQAPFYVAGKHLQGTGLGTNGVYHGTNGVITTDDYYHPLQKVRAMSFTIVPGRYVEAHDAMLCAGDVPVFYLPYYRHDLNQDQNQFTFLPGYRSAFGPYLLSSYNWLLNDQLRGAVHADYREKRGPGAGPDFNYNFGEFGEGMLRYYYAHDSEPGTDPINLPLPENRQRVYFSYDAHPATNLTIQSQVAYQSDPYITRDFFESEYNRDIQPSTFLDVNQFWRNWSVDALAQPRVNPFWETVERLPDVRLSGFRQEIGSTPVYYESQSSLGYFRRQFADTNLNNGGDYAASRADTYHQLTMPENFFGWLNFTPRVGGRYTYYETASGPGATTTNQSREVFNTGAEVSFTTWRLWKGAESDFWDVDGIRHIFQPSINYVYVPRPNVLPSQLPQFDYQLTNNLRMLPIDFPDYNSIDSINSENALRYGLNNRLQTKRNGELDDLVNWGVYMDWNLRPRTDQSTFSDIYSDFSLKPRSWLTFNSATRYSIENEQFNLAQHTISFQPGSTWSWTVGHLYVRTGPILGPGDNLYTSLFFYRLNENWGTRLAHYFDASTGTLQEQDYTIYRDLRSWTAALTFRELNNLSKGKDYAVAFTFSFKSFPRFPLGQDTVRSASLVGY